MADREKVIKALELEIKHPYSWECAKECPYYGKTECDCYTQVSMDALELLKKPELREAPLKTEFAEGGHTKEH